MFSRTFSSIVAAAAASLMLAACDSATSTAPSPNAVASASPAGPAITCATGGSTTLGPGCMLERLAGGAEIVLYHPDGGFRRLTRNPETGELVAKDGAELLVVEERSADMVQLAVAGDRYRIPLALLSDGA